MRILFSIPVTPPAKTYGAERHHLTLIKAIKRLFGDDIFIFSYNAETIEDIWRSLLRGGMKTEESPYGTVYKFPVANVDNILLNPLSAIAHKVMFIASHTRGFPDNLLRALTILSDFYLLRAGYTYSSLIREYLEKIQPEIVHVYGIHLFWLPYILSRLVLRNSSAGLILWTIYHHFVRYERYLFERPKIKNILSGADAIITSTHYERSVIERYIGGNKNEIHVIPVPVDLESFLNPPKEYCDKLREKLGNPDHIILTMTLNEDKGSLNVLRALIDLRERYNVVFVSFGRSRLEDLNKFNKLKNKLPNNVKAFYFGYVKEETKALLYTIADVFAMPSIADSFGMAYAEAWYYNTPVIADDNPVMREVIGSSRGLLVRRNNIEEIKTAIRTLVEDKTLARKLAENGKRYLYNELDSLKVAAKVRKLYEDVSIKE